MSILNLNCLSEILIDGVSSDDDLDTRETFCQPCCIKIVSHKERKKGQKERKRTEMGKRVEKDRKKERKNRKRTEKIVTGSQKMYEGDGCKKSLNIT